MNKQKYMKYAETDNEDSNIEKWLEISLKKRRQRIWLLIDLESDINIKWVCILIIE